ncbi:LysR substrate-binding domain-containing protein [Rhodovibrionaceae bacterium A322]
MKSYRHTLPPLDVLLFFEAAARHLNFTEAAAELLVSQTAVSKRVRQLEDHLGLPLFLRDGRRLELTEAGYKLKEQSQALLDYAQSSLQSLAAAPDLPVRIAANSAISLFWLSPHLKAFGLSAQACAVELVTSDRTADLLSPDNDLAVLHGNGKWQGLIATPLFPDSLSPVMSKSLAEKLEIAPGTDLQDLTPDQRSPLLTFTRLEPSWTNWDNWGGADQVTNWPRVVCNTYAQSIGAALSGQGIALASASVLSQELSNGDLLMLGPTVVSQQRAYYLAQPDKALPNPQTDVLKKALLEAVA